MGRAGRRLPQQGALFQARRRGRARGRRAGLEAELQQLDLGAEAAAPTGTGLVRDGGHGDGHGDGRPPGGPALQELFQRCVPVQCRPASDEELLLVHSPSFVAKLEPPESPGPGVRGPRGAVGAALALLEPLLGGALRNGVALISPQDPQDPPQPAAVAARVAQKQLGVQRVLIVDWSPRPGRSLARIFQEDPSVLYFGAQRGRDSVPSTGDGPGEGFSVELQWEQATVTDGDFAAAAFNILLPIGLQFQPQLVLVEASLEDLGGALGVSPAGFSPAHPPALGPGRGAAAAAAAAAWPALPAR
ncbi:protein deacetylase HDAC6 [Zonotrichia albicollis]|uniref:protein deacetylase HDAC6 n=1 Tax=Zonotrichia albicollis TaxID=44394 RepID=UPI003D80F5D0